MKTENLQLPTYLFDMAENHFPLLKPENRKEKRDTVELRLSGYRDVMHLIADIVKVSLLALAGEENGEHPCVPDPLSNVSGVLSIVLDLIPYEEADLLDRMRYGVLSGPMPVLEDDWDFILESISLVPPRELENEEEFR